MKDIKCTIIYDKADLLNYQAFVAANNKLAFDIETSGVNYRKDVIMGIGVSNGEEGYYLPLREWNKETGEFRIYRQQMHECVKGFLEPLNGKKLLAWNGAFEAYFMESQTSWSFLQNFYSDAMLKLHLIDENRYNYGLKEYAYEMYGTFATDKQDAMLESIKINGGTKKEYYKSDTEPLGIYCIYDCVLTYWIDEQLDSKLKAQGLWNFFYVEETMPLLKEVTIPMEMRGIALDMQALTAAKENIEKDIAAIETNIQTIIAPHLDIFTTWFLNKDYPPARTGAFAQAFCELHNVPLPKTKAGKYSLGTKNIDALEDGYVKQVLNKEAYMSKEDIGKVQMILWKQENKQYMFNLNSKHHLKKLFFDTLKEEPLSTTPKGSPQVNEEFLNAMAEKYEWCSLLRVYNKLIKINGTYITRFLDEQEEGRFYPSFHMHRTVSGRYSGDLQQLPRILEDEQDDSLVVKYTNMIRNFFVADNGGYLIGADYESLEPHVFAHVSGDEGLKDIFRQGHDFYSTIAIRTEGLTEYSADKSAENYLGKLAKSLRQKAKAYALGIPYGLSGYKLKFQLDCEQDEADALVASYLEAFPDLAAWMRRSEEMVRKQGYVKTELGRIRHLGQAKQYLDRYGDVILDSLQLWKQYNESPAVYAKMKSIRKQVKNMLNNANNFQIQGLSASIVNRAAIAFNRKAKELGLDALIVMQVHDELVVSATEEHTEEAAKWLQYCMENTVKISLNLKAEPQIARVYAEAK